MITNMKGSNCQNIQFYIYYQYILLKLYNFILFLNLKNLFNYI